MINLMFQPIQTLLTESFAIYAANLAMFLQTVQIKISQNLNIKTNMNQKSVNLKEAKQPITLFAIIANNQDI